MGRKAWLLVSFVASAMMMLTVFVVPPAWSQSAPWDFNGGMEPVSATVSAPGPASSKGVFLRGLQVIFSSVSRVDGTRCPMTPTCSAYSIQSFGDYGLLKGFVMTADRLIRCGGNTTEWTSLKGGGYYDPPAHNDFWGSRSACSRCRGSN